jgi:hypothetical protein
MGRLRRTFGNQAVSVLCALALMLVAFAHRPVETDPRLSDPHISAYLALTGSLADLRISGEEDQDHAAHADCPACTLAKSMGLAPACLAAMGLVVRSSHRAAWSESLVLTGHGPRAPPARGPPFIHLI